MPSLGLILLFGGAMGAMFLVYAAMSGPATNKATSRRLENLRERHSRSSETVAQAHMRRIFAQRASRSDSFAKRFIPNPALLQLRLTQTGKSWRLGQYLMASAGLAVTMIGLLIFQGLPFLLAITVGLLIGVALPHMVVSKLIARRIKQFNSKFPDAIELMVRGLRSGLPISETMQIVAEEIPDPVGIEFRMVSDKMKIGRTMDAALTDTAERLGTPEFQFFVITLAIQRETGGNLAETLSNLSDVLRKRAQMKLKIRAMSSESKASAYIVGALPFIVFVMVWFINPKYMQDFFVDQRLIVAGIGGLIWMSIGGLIMAKMVSFEI